MVSLLKKLCSTHTMFLQARYRSTLIINCSPWNVSTCCTISTIKSFPDNISAFIIIYGFIWISSIIELLFYLHRDVIYWGNVDSFCSTWGLLEKFCIFFLLSLRMIAINVLNCKEICTRVEKSNAVIYKTRLFPMNIERHFYSKYSRFLSAATRTS